MTAVFAFLIALSTLIESLPAWVGGDDTLRQNTQASLASQLSSGNADEVRRALEAVRTLDPQELSDEVRAAMADALVQESRRNNRRYWQDRRKTPPEPLPDPELIAALAEGVAELGDPRTIPALAEALGVGLPVIRALASFGDDAAPAVLTVLMAPESTHYAVNDGLIALRFMVERSGTSSSRLTAATVARMKAAAERHLTVRPRFIGTVWWAIDLAVSLQDEGLRAIVEGLATDPGRVMDIGVSDPDVVYQTQRRAADRLAGVPPLPRP